MPEPRLIACLIYPAVMSLDVTGPLQVFASANVERQRQGLPPFYRIQVLGERSEAVPSSAGIRICADLAWRDCPPESLETFLFLYSESPTFSMMAGTFSFISLLGTPSISRAIATF